MAIESLGAESCAHNACMMADLMPRLTSTDARLKDMDRMGIDVQALSPSPTQYYYWADREMSGTIVDLQNDQISAMCASDPRRFVGIGAVSLQYPDLAVAQLDDCVKRRGFRGVEVSSTVNGREIADPEFFAFWRKAEELGVIVFLHPFGTSLGRRLNRYYLANLVGIPLETTIALSHLIFGGVLDQYPGLKILAAHGGGFLGSYWGRSQHAWKVRPECQNVRRSPHEYLKKIFFDSVVFTSDELQHIVRSVGVSQLVIGTDYPFDMGNLDPLELIESVQELSEEDKAAIVGGNASELLGIHETTA